MNIFQAADTIKILYRTNNNEEVTWTLALNAFDKILLETEDVDVLEACVLADENWELSVSQRLDLLRKTKLLGANSRAFLKDYYGFLAAHLDPGLEKTNAKEQLIKLMR